MDRHNSYYALAMNDLKYLKQDLRDEEGAYNRQVIDMHMILERLLKGIVETVEISDYRDKASILHSHNLRLLGSVVNDNCGLQLDLTKLAFLKDFYFEAQYPGDEFVWVDKDTHEQCLGIFLEELKKILQFYDTEKSDVETERMDLFDF